MRFLAQTDDFGSSDGCYCITLSTHGQRKLLTGTGPLDTTAVPTSIGSAVIAAWRALPQRFPHLATDTLYLMPDGVCGIVTCPGDGTAALRLLHRAVSAFKAETTRIYNLGSAQDYHSRLWQTVFRCEAIPPAGLGALRQQMTVQRAYVVQL